MFEFTNCHLDELGQNGRDTWLNGGQTEILILEHVIIHAKCQPIPSSVFSLISRYLGHLISFPAAVKPQSVLNSVRIAYVKFKAPG